MVSWKFKREWGFYCYESPLVPLDVGLYITIRSQFIMSDFWCHSSTAFPWVFLPRICKRTEFTSPRASAGLVDVSADDSGCVYYGRPAYSSI